MIGIAKKHIPRRYRKKYIPNWSQESEDLYKMYQVTNNNHAADELLFSLSKFHRKNGLRQ